MNPPGTSSVARPPAATRHRFENLCHPRRLKEDDQLQGIPVIIVTGISDDFKKFISTRRQVPPPEGCISKPVNHEQFLKMVNDLLP